jgi:hypothetical protein
LFIVAAVAFTFIRAIRRTRRPQAAR